MNCIFRTLWSVATQSWQAVPETAKSAGKGGGSSSQRASKSSASGMVSGVALGLMASGGVSAQAPPQPVPAPTQLPTGGKVAQGVATLSQTTTAQAAALSVTQSSQRAVVNWDTFNLGSAASINFAQPNAQAVTLNRVNDANPSQIFGRITAPGRVVLTNAQGIYFSPTSQVDVGGLVATTHSISDDNFMAGNYRFERNGATGKVVNEGQLNAALGGYIALLAPEVQNAGVVVAQAGTVAMATGDAITLNFAGNYTLASITTTLSTLATLVNNQHAVMAPDGQIILSAVALNKLQAGVVKNSGRLEANSLVSKGGKIVLEGDDITLTRTSKLEAKGATGGGTVLVGGDWQGSGDLRQATKVTMEAGATIDASATDKGDGGKVVLWSDVHNADSVTRVNGSIKAEGGANGGDGGQVETSGRQLKLDGVEVTTFAAQGNAGQWLIDPYDFTVAPSGGDITGTALSSALGSNNITINAGATSSASNTSTTFYGSTSGTVGDININDNVNWGSKLLTLTALGNVNVNATMNAWGSSTLAITTGATYKLLMGLNKAPAASGGGFYGSINFTTLAGGSAARTGLNILNINSTNYYLIGSVGAEGDFATSPGATALTLQGAKWVATPFSIAMATDIDASVTSSWNSTAGFKPIDTVLTNFNGLGHMIKGLYIKSSGQYAGLFSTSPTNLLNLGLDSTSTIQSTAAASTYNNTATNFNGITAAKTGSIAGSMNAGSSMYNVFSNAAVSATTGTAGGIVGLIVGGTIDNSGSYGSVKVSIAASDTTSSVAAGGFFGGSSTGTTTINNSVAGGDVSIAHPSTSGTTQSLYAGGFGGYSSTINFPINFTNSAASGAVSITGANAYSRVSYQLYGAIAGGFIGWAYGQGADATKPINFQNDSASGAVSVNKGVAAGFAGSLEAYGYTGSTVQITESFSTGNVSVSTADAANSLGGFIGTKYSGTGTFLKVQYSYSTGNATALGNLGTTGAFIAKTEGNGGETFSYNYARGTNTGGLTNNSTISTWFTAANKNYFGAAAASNLSNLNSSGTTYWAQDSDINNNDPYLLNNFPTIFNPSLSVKSTGTWGGLTATALRPVLVGTGINGATVNIYDGKNTVGTATVASGAWVYQFASNLAVGLHAYKASQTTTGSKTSNYSLVSTFNSLPVLYVVANAGQSVAYGSTPSVNYSLFTDVSATTVQNGVSLNGAAVFTGVSNTSDVGTYAISYSTGGLSSAFYNFAAGPATNFSISPAIAKISATKIFDTSTALTAGQLTISGVNGQTLGYAGTPVLQSPNVANNATNYVSGITGLVDNGTYLASNYQLPSLTAASVNNVVSISKVTASIAAAKTYDTSKSLTNAQVTINGLNGQTLNYAGTAVLQSPNVIDNATNYVSGITALADNGTYLASNYQLPGLTAASVNNVASIAKATVSITAAKTYDTSTSLTNSQVTIRGVNGQTLNYAGTAVLQSSNVIDNATNYVSGITGLADNGTYLVSNYQLPSLTAASVNNGVSIGKATLSLSGSQVYNGSPTFLATNLVASGVSSQTFALTGNDATLASANVTTSPVSQSFTGLSLGASSNGGLATNYNAVTSTANVSITPATAKLSGLKVYDGTTNLTGAQLSITGVTVNGTAQTLSYTAGTASLFDVNVLTPSNYVIGSGLVLGNGTGLASNYVLPSYSYNAASNTASVSPASATVTANKNYNGDTSLSAGQVTITGVRVNGGAAQTLGFTGTATLSDANAYTFQKYVNTASMSLADGTGIASNYALPTSAHHATYNTAVIQKLALTASDINVGTSVYGDAFVPGTVTFTNKPSNTDDVNATVTVTVPAGSLSAGGVAKAGNYYQSASTILTGVQAGNYSFAGLTSSLSANYSVTQRALLASRITSGQSVYASAVTPGTAQFLNLVGSDDVSAPVIVNTGAVSSSGHYVANSYTQTASSVLTGADKDNYSLVGGYTTPTANYTIQQKPITVASIANGSSTYASTLAPGAVTLNNIVSTGTGTDDVSSTATVVTRNNTSTSGNLKASTYAQTAASNSLSGTDAGNYSLTTFTTPTNNYTVGQLALTASGDIAAARTTYGSSLVPGTLALANKVGSDKVSAVVNVDTSTLSNGGKPIVGSYTQTASTVLAGDDASNYTFVGTTSSTANYTIDPLALTVASIASGSSVYASGLAPGAVTFGNAVTSDRVSTTASVNTSTLSTSRHPIAGGYTQTASTVLTGDDASNYTFAGYTSPANYTIQKLALAGASIAASNSTYSSTLNPGAVTFTNIVSNGTGTDDVASTATVVTGATSQSGNPVIGTYAQTAANNSLRGTDAGNYSFAGFTTSTNNYTITQKELTISVPGASRVYDGSTLIYPTGISTLVGVVGSDHVVINAGNVTGFVDKNVGVNKPVTYTGFTFNGNDASNYVLLANPASTAEITPKPITVSGIAANDKVYNATTTASLNVTSATLTRGALSSTDNKVYNSDNVSVDTSLAVGTFANANVGTAKPVTISGLTLSGNDAGNYTVTDASNATASITAKALTVSGLSTAASRVYNGTLGATVTGAPALLTAQAAGSGTDTDGVPYTVDVISFTGSATGTYNSKDVSSANMVTFGGLASSNNNYTLSLGTQAATITAKTLTVSGFSAPSSRVYDGTQVAIASGTPSLLTAQTAGAGSSTDGTPYVGDVIGFNGTASATYNTKDVGTATTISFGGLASNNTNYTLAFGTQAGSITPKALTVSGLSVASSREYNAGLAATVTGTPTLLSSEASGSGSSNDGKPYATDTIGFNGAATGTYNSKDVASASTVTLGGLTSDNSNYALALGTQAATITSKALTVTGTTVASKTYDGTATATLSNGALVGVLRSDTAHVSLNEAGNFADKNVGIAKPVTSTNTITGTEAGNYSLTQPTGLSADITKADLAVTGVSAVNKVYDTTRNATLTGTASVTGFSGDTVGVIGTGAGLFADKNAASGKFVTVTGYALGGADAGNYNVVQPVGLTADITAKALTVANTTVANKVYDGTTAATLSNGTLVGVISADAANVTLTQAGTFADKNVGTAKVVTAANTIAGSEAGNYSLTQPSSLSADITAKALTVSGTAVANKVYDGTTVATLSNATLVGVISADAANVTLTQAGTFADKNVGTAKTVTASNTITGAEAGNYRLIQPSGLTADITASTTTGTVSTPIFQTPAQIAAMNSANMAALPVSQLAAFTATQLTAIPVSLMASLSVQQLGSLSPTQLGSFSNSQLSGMTLSQVASLSSNQLTGFTPAQLALLLKNDVTSVTSPVVPPVVLPPAMSTSTPVVPPVMTPTFTASPSTSGLTLNPSLTPVSVVIPATAPLTEVAPAVSPSSPVTSPLPIAIAATPAPTPSPTVTSVSSSVQAVAVVAAAATSAAATNAAAEKGGSATGGEGVGTVTSTSGVVVNTIRVANRQTTGVVAVLVPKGSSSSGTGMVISLPEDATTLSAATQETVKVSLVNGASLPSWIKYLPEQKGLVLGAVPEGGLPVQVVVMVGNQRTIVQISESQIAK